MSLKIVRQFASTSMQGAPLWGLRRFGVAPGGAQDRESLALANALVGKDPDEPALEVIGGSIEVIADEDGALAVVGADCTVNGVPGNSRFTARRGDQFQLSLGLAGFTYYLAFGSPRSESRMEQGPSSIQAQLIRVLSGPQAKALGNLPASHVVSNQISRAGIRLQTCGLAHSLELPSEPACLGAIQITPDGTPIILGPDGPTIGGYPKVAVVCSADLDKLAHLRPGSTVTFQQISLEEAKELKLARDRDLRRRVSELSLHNLNPGA